MVFWDDFTPKVLLNRPVFRLKRSPAFELVYTAYSWADNGRSPQVNESQNCSEQTQTVPPCPKSLLMHLEYFGGETAVKKTNKRPANAQKFKIADFVDWKTPETDSCPFPHFASGALFSSPVFRAFLNMSRQY